MSERALISQIEACAFRAWPAAQVVDMDGWSVRFMSGVTRRANSAWPHGDDVSGAAIDRRIARVRAFYADRGLPARVQMCPACVPTELDQRLERLGWEIETPVSVQRASIDEVLAHVRPAAGSLRVDVDAAITDAWFDIAATRGRYHDVQSIYRGLLQRLAGRAGYALARWDGESVGVGKIVLDADWAGVFSMHTLPTWRRRGVGRAILSAMVMWARDRGAQRVYLQVERDNAPASALYHAAGFRELHGYHYRRLSLAL